MPRRPVRPAAPSKALEGMRQFQATTTPATTGPQSQDPDVIYGVTSLDDLLRETARRIGGRLILPNAAAEVLAQADHERLLAEQAVDEANRIPVEDLAKTVDDYSSSQRVSPAAGSSSDDSKEGRDETFDQLLQKLHVAEQQRAELLRRAHAHRDEAFRLEQSYRALQDRPDAAV
jgi:hypothetical protein